MIKIPSFRKQNKDEDLETLMESYTNLYDILAGDIALLDSMKASIVALVKERGESYEHGRVLATIRKPYTRTSWDTGGLNGYAVANPDVLKFKKETQVGESVAVKVVGDGESK